MRRLGLALLLSLLLAACSSAPHIPTDTRQQLSEHRQLSVPFIAQQDYYCGPAAIASIARYRQLQADQQTIAAMSFLPGRRGSLTPEMQAASRRLGLMPYPLGSSFSDLLREVDAGNPVLVLQNQGLSWFPQWHYAVVLGYDLASETLYLHSGEHPNYALSFATFNATWARADFWARVLVDSGNVPASARPLPYLRSANAFEETGQRALAKAFYRQASQHWPRQPEGWLARANLAYADGDMAAASAHYRRALQQAPDNASLWNNYAYSLDARSCADAARAAIAKAAALAPDDSNIVASQQELEGSSANDQRCPADTAFIEDHRADLP